ncbi:NAD-dependent epimerase/dehydratase family protein [Methylophilus sp. 3sh_L]|uniref:NAD-dependent epimerase/dehydratase family protein n=1 Tax=Methylophilus sp. 3sh_L TaxID=3377114 RepID=UPI00398E7E72
MHVLQIGCGALGQLIAQATLAQGHTLTIVRRSPQPGPAGVQVLAMDVVTQAEMPALANQSPEILLYCLAPVAGQTYQQTYVDGLRHVLANIDQRALKHVFFVSSTSVYGEQQGQWIEEDTPAIPAEENGQVILAAERLLDGLSCPHTALRVSGIYGPQRLYLLKLLQSPARWPQHIQWTNRIHELDVAGAVVHFYREIESDRPLPAHIILTDGKPVPQHEVLQWLAQRLEQPGPLTPPSSLQTGKRIRNQFLQQSGYRFLFADYQAGYAAILSEMDHA